MLILSTCWYLLKCKFNKTIYETWISNFLNNVNNFYLVIYTNLESYNILEKYKNNPKIKIIIFEIPEFYNYKYKQDWIKNHEKNYLLNNKICWEVNMLWSEKISFVKKTYDEKYFDGEWYGWCDIGYFRGYPYDIPHKLIKEWPNPVKVEKLDKSRIYYAKINNDKRIFNEYIKIILNKNEYGLSKNIIPHEQSSIAGGFFLIYYTKIDWWHTIFDNKLKLYFENDRIVKDDQIIILDNIISNRENFILVESEQHWDWFLFQRYLL